MTTTASPTEEFIENVGSGLLQSLGIPSQRGRQIDEAGERAAVTACVLGVRLTNALQRLNPHLPAATVQAIAVALSRPPQLALIENNRWFHDLLTNGVPVEYKDPKTGETRGGRARLVDFDHPTDNDFLLARQLIIAGANGKVIRPDLLLFVNGLPLVVIELKDPANTAANLDAAIDQLGRYKAAVPDLFVPNLLLVASDGLLTRVGSITSAAAIHAVAAGSRRRAHARSANPRVTESFGTAGLSALMRGV